MENRTLTVDPRCPNTFNRKSDAEAAFARKGVALYVFTVQAGPAKGTARARLLYRDENGKRRQKTWARVTLKKAG